MKHTITFATAPAARGARVRFERSPLVKHWSIEGRRIVVHSDHGASDMRGIVAIGGAMIERIETEL